MTGFNMQTDDLKTLPFHPDSEMLVKNLCTRTNESAPMFFRVLVAYYFGKVASMMRVSVKGPEGLIPVNVYAFNLATSGFGKGKSTNILENEVINQFRDNYLGQTFITQAEEQLYKEACKRSQRNKTDPDEELDKLRTEFNNLGTLRFGFNSGTSQGARQLRQKLLIAKSGSLNLEMDEVGSNLTGNLEMLGDYLELFDMGGIKDKLTKHTKENPRGEELFGGTPANFMGFGTDSKLLDGDKTEKEFRTLLDTGYARRCLFGFTRGSTSAYMDREPDEIYDDLVTQVSSPVLQGLSARLGQLADLVNHGKQLVLSREVGIEWVRYTVRCSVRAEQIPIHKDLFKKEVKHRHWKAIKLAGAYAFIDGSHEVALKHLHYAIRLVEESGEAFEQLMSQDPTWVKLARFLAEVNTDITLPELAENLPYFKGNNGAKEEMLAYATAWGYKNNVIIKKHFIDGIKFLRGESLKKTDLSQITVSYSDHMAYRYLPEQVPFDQIHRLTQAQGHHWTNHHFLDQHRHDDKVIPGFNMVVIDVDGTCALSTAKLLLKDYVAHYYTTKRHGENGQDRFRILLPTNYFLKLDTEDYKEFMNALFDWLPFTVDRATGQCSKKWLSHAGHYEYGTGDQLLDVLPFIPKTKQAEEQAERHEKLRSLPALERWFISNTGPGNRNNNMIRYALILVDAGHSAAEVEAAVFNLNQQMQSPLTDDEIRNSILITAAKAIAQRAA